MPAPIPDAKRNAIEIRLGLGDAPKDIAADLGVSEGTVRNVRRRMGKPPAPIATHSQAQAIPAARAYIEGDDHAVDQLLSQMELKAQAETMYTLTRARNLHQDSRAVDVGVFADFLRHAADVLAGLGGPVEEWASAMNDYMHGNHPKVVDRLSRAGLM